MRPASHEPWRAYVEQQQQQAELRHLNDRVNGISDRVAQLSRRVDRGNTRMLEIEDETAERIKAVEARVDRLMEAAKWVAVGGMMLAGMWEKLPEPLRARLLGG
jgi:predicted  nucleic acid-binding Zn-ribbon protein